MVEKVSRIIDMTDNQFDKMVLRADEPVLAYFWATWCGPCKLMTPVLEEVGAIRNNLRIYKFDVETERAVMTEYDVRNVPTLLLFKNGELMGMKVGAVSKNQLLAFLDSTLM